MTPDGWRQCTLADIAADEFGMVDGPFGSNLPAACYTPVGVPVIRGSNLSLGQERFNAQEFVFVSEETAKRLERSLCKPGDIIFTKKGTLGQTGIVPDSIGYSKFLVSSNQMKLAVSRKVADPLFVYYYISSPESRDRVVRESTASGVPKINLAYLRKFPIILPPLNEQKAIACILGALDDKIELNRRMNHTLEEMARAIFKSWFVDFDPVVAKAEGRQPYGMNAETAALFPSTFQDSEMGLIPEGWRIGCVADLGDVICGKTPPTKEPSNFGADVPFITIPDMHGKVFTTVTERSLSFKGAEIQRGKYLPPLSVCVSCIATPGLVVLTSKTSQTNQQINSVVPRKEFSPYFCFWVLREIGGDVDQHGSSGTVFANLSKGGFAQLTILFPSIPLIQQYHRVARPLFERILNNEKESITLAAIRDVLLPKLLSGEIRVRQAENLWEQAT